MKKVFVVALAILATLQASGATIRIQNSSDAKIAIWLYPSKGKISGPYFLESQATEAYAPLFKTITNVAWHYIGKKIDTKKASVSLAGTSATGKYAADLNIKHYAKLEIFDEGTYQVRYDRFPSPREPQIDNDVAPRRTEEYLNSNGHKKKKQNKKYLNDNNNNENRWFNW